MTRRPTIDLSSTTWSASDVASEISSRENFRWVAGFLTKVNDLHLEVTESFQNADGSRVARWLLTGKNNGFLGTQPDQQDIAMTGTASGPCARTAGC
jgi:hypothetical protein